jgi:hypothetical protein
MIAACTSNRKIASKMRNTALEKFDQCLYGKLNMQYTRQTTENQNAQHTRFEGCPKLKLKITIVSLPGSRKINSCPIK